MSCELRLGHWSRTLRGREADALICDPPYSEQTHVGHSAGADAANAVADEAAVAVRRSDLPYHCWTPGHVRRFVRSWSPRVRGWFVAITDHVLAPVFLRSLEAEGRYVFAPLAFVNIGGTVRMRGDGPSSWSRWIVVARPMTAEFANWGTLRGGYCGPSDRPSMPGGKPLWLMRALVRDYSRLGDLVVDPCAGWGTTLLAARMENRDALGSEIDVVTHQRAIERLSAPHQPPLEARE